MASRRDGKSKQQYFVVRLLLSPAEARCIKSIQIGVSRISIIKPRVLWEKLQWLQWDGECGSKVFCIGVCVCVLCPI